MTYLPEEHGFAKASGWSRLAFSDTATVYYGLCDRHERRRRGMMAVAVAAFVAAAAVFVGMVVGAATQWLPSAAVGWALGTAMGLFVGGLVLRTYLRHPLFAADVRDNRVWVVGCGAGFLDTLPTYEALRPVVAAQHEAIADRLGHVGDADTTTEGDAEGDAE